MTREEEMALRELAAGRCTIQKVIDLLGPMSLWSKNGLEQEISKAVAAEREKVATWMIQRSYATGHGDTVEDLLKELEWQVAEREREACARVVEQMGIKGYGTLGIAAIIRARGNT